MSQRKQKRLREKLANKQFAKPETEFKEIDLTDKGCPSWMTRAYHNERYVVMINDNCKTDKGTAIRAMVQQHDDKPIENHWSKMQKIKNELFGEETMAIEYYPRESKLTNDHNIYWMWIFPEGVIPEPL